MKWTDKDIQFLQNNLQTMSKEDLAKKLNRSVAAITGKIRQLTLTEPKKVIKLTRLQKNYIEQNADSLTVKEIAEDLEMDEEEVSQIVNKPKDIIVKAKRDKTQMQKMMKSSVEGVTVMTPNASAHGDSVRSTGKQSNMSHIHKIYED